MHSRRDLVLSCRDCGLLSLWRGFFIDHHDLFHRSIGRRLCFGYRPGLFHGLFFFRGIGRRSLNMRGAGVILHLRRSGLVDKVMVPEAYRLKIHVDLGLRGKIFLLQAFIDDGHEVVVACHDDDESKQKALQDLGCTMVEVPFNGKGTKPNEELKLINTYKKLVKNQNPDIVFTFTIKMNLYGGLAAKKYKVPFVPMITGLGELEKTGKLRRILMFLHKRVMPFAKAVVFQNDIIEKAIDGAPGVFDGFGPLIDADIKAGVLKREGFTDRPFNLQDYVQDFRTQLAALCSMYGFTFNLGVLHLKFSSGSGVSFGETFVSSIGSLKEHFEQMKEKQSKG